MRKNLTKKLFLSVLTLAFAVISLGASTYAWFTMSNQATVEAFTADVKAGEGIEVAVTPTADHSAAQWYTGLVPTSVVQAAAVPTNFVFDAVTSKDAAATIVERGGTTEITEGYIKFYIHIKAAQGGTIKLDGITLDSKANGADVEAWTADAAYALDGTRSVVVNDKVLYEVENAARVSIKADTNTTIYEKAAVAATGEKVADGVSTYVAGNQKGQNVTNGAYSYYNAKMAEDLDIAQAVQYSTTELEELPTENNTLKAVTKGEVLTIEVKVWIEGWDAECLNAIFAQTLSVAFSFKYEE